MILNKSTNLLLGALLASWSAFVPSQDGINNLTFTILLSNTLQQNSVSKSKNDTNKSSALISMSKATFVKPKKLSNSRCFQKPKHSKFQSSSLQ